MFGAKGKNKSGAKIIIIILIIVALITGGIAAALLLRNTSDEDDIKDNENSNKEIVKEFEEKIGDDTEAVIETVNRFFNAYEEFDAETIDELGLAPFMDESNSYTFARMYERYANKTDDYRANFIMTASLGAYMSTFTSSDFADSDTTSKVMEYYDDRFDIDMDFKIKNICTSNEIESIGFRSGLSVATADPDEKINDIFGGNVEEWYAVLVKGKWYLNGAEFGYDNDLLAYLVDNLDEGSLAKGMIENYRGNTESNLEVATYTYKKEGFWFIVYKYDNRWYIYHPNFVEAVNRRLLEVELKESNDK